ncbi:DUF6248 family natural product biosynthesis protein [Streptomyces goshikiensis]|uniref:DUF6248 family natural product biosynthesis protein n=1 Tax=Streptomyces goshikiensis TaxID=1942 RepID=UPI0022F397B5|nr:DUF6248 family natural product biosynthesis protein [Streptomyces goshikiensis]WBY25129.1 DUF6248 family natural product biosynthesis protein [Streptomyces goshikiensis]
MNETQGTPAPDTSTPPEPQQLLRIARTAAELAVAAADHATEAVCRSRSGSTSRLEEVMHTAHTHAVEAEKCAGWAAGWETDDTAEYVLHRYVTSAVDAAIRAQSAAGVEVTATVLHSQLEQPPTAQEHAERESERRREEAEEEAAERAATGMDKDNRHQARMNDYYAESAVPQLGWTAGHVRVLEAAETGRLYWRDKQARQAARHGQWEGGRRVSSERTRALYGARFLIGARRDDGTRILALSPMGQVALELARLHPEGLYATDQEAYQARYDQVAKRYQRSDDKKAAARRLPPLYDGALRFYRRPVTLAEQELQAQRDAAEQWEDEGGCCPGVQTPRPAAEVAAEPTTPAARRSVTAAAPAGQELLRRLFAPRRTPEQARDPLRTVIRRPRRALTPQEREIVQDVPLLTLQGALIMGLVDPVPNVSPMPETDGAWVREHVWPDHVQPTEQRYPWGFRRWSMCERGVCWNCLSKRCDLCVHRQKGGPDVDDNKDWVHGPTGHVVAQLILRTDDAPCVWWCRCPCAKDGPAPSRKPAPAPTPEPAPKEIPPARTTRRRTAERPSQDALF